MRSAQAILIVEDDHDLRRMYRDTLSLAGYEVQEARGGFEALRRLDTDRPDAIVLDLGLPGVDGYTVRNELAAHAHTRHIPILVVTGATENLDSLEVACLLRKPVAPDELVAAVRRCLAAATGTR